MSVFPPSTEIPLQQRLEYIARAILSAKSSTAISSTAADGEFLHELEEKMEVSDDTKLWSHSALSVLPLVSDRSVATSIINSRLACPYFSFIFVFRYKSWKTNDTALGSHCGCNLNLFSIALLRFS